MLTLPNPNIWIRSYPHSMRVKRLLQLTLYNFKKAMEYLVFDFDFIWITYDHLNKS